jgi:hypothetical protein
MKKIRNVAEVVRIAHLTGVPVLVWGPPGVGKTAAIEAAARDMGLHCETLVAGWRDPSDVLGYMVPDLSAGTLSVSPTGWAQRLVEAGDSSVLFVDELTTAPAAVQAALLRVVHERVVADMRLPAGCAIVAAANPTDLAAGGEDLTAPLATRFHHVEYEPDALSWAEGFVTYWGAPPRLRLPEDLWQPWRLRIAAFIRRRPELLIKVPETDEERGRPWPNPRTWDHVSRVLAAAGAVDPEVVAGSVGNGPALELAEYLASLDLPDPEAVLADPAALVWLPDRSDWAFAVLSAIVARAVADLTAERWSAAWAVIGSACGAGYTDVACATAAALARARRPGLPALPRDLLARIAPVMRAAGMLA